MDTTTIKINNTNSQSVDYAFFGANVSSASVLTDGATIASVRVASTDNINLGGIVVGTDGIAFAVGDRVLVRIQDTGSENGIYTFPGSRVLERSSDYDTDAEVNNNDLIAVNEGNTFAGETFRLDTADPITLGTTDLDFVLNNSSIIDIANRSFDEMQRQSANKPFIINTLKVRWDNDSQALERIRFTYKNMTGFVCEEELFPIDYIEQSNNRNEFIKIINFNRVITGNITIQGTVLANTLLTFIINYTLIPMPYGLNDFSAVHFFEDCGREKIIGKPY